MRLSESTLSPPEYARRLGVKVNKIHDWIRSGELRAVDVASKAATRPRYRLTAEAIEEFERRRSTRKPVKRQSRRRNEPWRIDPEIEAAFPE